MKARDKGSRTNETSAQQKTIKNEKKVEFSLQAPEVKEVFLAGEFNQWDLRSMPMERGNDRNWKIRASFPPGRYEYKFLVDNHWLEDLPGTELVPNPFGTQNCVLWVE